MARQPARTKGTGKAGSHSSRRTRRADAKDSARTGRRQEDKAAVAATVVDVRVANHGSIWLLTPQTDAARQWVADYLSPDTQMFGEAVAVEPRYVHDIVTGMRDEGLVVA